MRESANTLPPLVSDLLDPAAYPHPVDDVRLVQTHISYVLLAGDFAYKIKKPLDLGFLDYSTLERRRHFCHEEVRLNRRLCEGVYLGVVPIARASDGRHRVEGAGEAVEYAVRMRRVPEGRTLPALLARGVARYDEMAVLARRLAAFHAAAPSSPDCAVHGRVATVRAIWEETFEQVQPYVGRTLSGERLALLRAYVARFLERRGGLIEQRAGAGCVRDGHGDLRADSVVLGADGSVCVMDCIEFSERLRCGDVAAELAFPAMDLDFRGRPGLADALCSHYLEATGDETLPVLVQFYRAQRACVRGKVDSIQIDEPEIDDSQRRAAADRAERYFALAERYAAEVFPQALMITVGLSGSGKSFLARAVAVRAQAALIGSDAIRRTVVDEAPAHVGWGEAAYSGEQRRRVYGRMFDRAREHLSLGRSALLDATFIATEDRAAAVEVARDAAVPLLALEVSAPDEVVRARMAAREGTAGPSDARWDTYLEQRRRFEPPSELPEDLRISVDGSRPLEELVPSVLAALSRV